MAQRDRITEYEDYQPIYTMIEQKITDPHSYYLPIGPVSIIVYQSDLHLVNADALIHPINLEHIFSKILIEMAGEYSKFFEDPKAFWVYRELGKDIQREIAKQKQKERPCNDSTTSNGQFEEPTKGEMEGESPKDSDGTVGNIGGLESVGSDESCFVTPSYQLTNFKEIVHTFFPLGESIRNKEEGDEFKRKFIKM